MTTTPADTPAAHGFRMPPETAAQERILMGWPCRLELWGGELERGKRAYAEVANTIRGAARYGVDAHIDRVRWNDIVSRVFGRIDPIAPRTPSVPTTAPGALRIGRHRSPGAAGSRAAR